MKSIAKQLIDECNEFCDMVEEVRKNGACDCADARYKEITTELLLFIFLVLRRLMFFGAFALGTALYVALR